MLPRYPSEMSVDLSFAMVNILLNVLKMMMVMMMMKMKRLGIVMMICQFLAIATMVMMTGHDTLSLSGHVQQHYDSGSFGPLQQRM